MKDMIFKKLTVCLLAFAVLLGLGGCGGASGGRSDIIHEAASDDQEQVSLTFFGFKADAMNQIAIEAALQGYMEKNSGVNITYDCIKGPPYYEALDRRYETGSLDDVFMSKESYILSMAADGALADLSGLRGVDGFSEQAKEQFTNPDGTVYFLPTCISTYNLYINYDLLKAHGQSIPENWEQFQQVCDYFVAQGIVPIIGNNYASLSTLITSRGLFDTYQRSDVAAAIESFNHDPALLAETLAPGVELVAEMLERGWFDPAEVLITEQTSDDLVLFEKGDRPFMISGGWASVRVSATEPGFSYGVHPYPILDDGSVLSMQVDTCIVVNAASKHLAEAKDFVEYLIQPDVMWAYCDSQASYTPLQNETRIPSDATLVPSTEYLTNGRFTMRSEFRMTLPTEGALNSCVGILLHGGTVAEAQAALAEELAK